MTPDDLAWRDRFAEALRRDLRRPVAVENDVNLAAIAERSYGAAKEIDDFALMWMGEDLGLARVVGGRVHRGPGGGAGEIGYLPLGATPLEGAAASRVPVAPPDPARATATPAPVTSARAQYGPPGGGPNGVGGRFQSLAGEPAVRALAHDHGFTAPTAAGCVAAAVAAAGRGEPGIGRGRGDLREAGRTFLGELAHRISLGVASVCVVLDLGLVVLGGEVGRAGGPELAARVAAEVGRICPGELRVAASEVDGNPVLRGGLLAALERAREDVFAESAGAG